MVTLTEKEKTIAEKIIGLIKRKIPMNKESPTGMKNGKDSDDSGSSASESRWDKKRKCKSQKNIEMLLQPGQVQVKVWL